MEGWRDGGMRKRENEGTIREGGRGRDGDGGMRMRKREKVMSGVLDGL